jgi:hypothetical protein
MKKIFLILAASMIILTGCGGDTTAVSASASAPVNGYVTPAGINAVPSQ